LKKLLSLSIRSRSMRNPSPPKAVSTESGKDGRRLFHKKKSSDINPLNGIVYNPNPETESISDISCLGVASTTFESSTNTSSIEDWLRDGATTSQQGLSKAEGERKSFAPQGLTQAEKLTKLNSHSGQENNIQFCKNLVAISTEEGGKSAESLTKQFQGSIGDPDILSKLKKEFDKGDEGLLSCLSFLKETVAEQKQVYELLGSRIVEEDLLFRSLGDKIRKYKAKFYEAQDVHKKSLQTSVLQKDTTEDEQKKSTLSTRKIANLKGSSSRSAKSRAQPRLLLKINQLHENRTSTER